MTQKAIEHRLYAQRSTPGLAEGEGIAFNPYPKSQIIYTPIDGTKTDFANHRKYSPHDNFEYSNIGDLPNDTWMQPKHWTDTPWGRAAIEFVARITLGGMFYAWVGQSDSMDKVSTKYDPSNFRDRTDKTWLEWVAYGVDTTLGKGIKKTATLLNGGDAEKADEFTRFRTERFKADPNHVVYKRPKDGRSYGAEFVSVVADFGGMTAGTYIAREILYGTLNPNERAAWAKNGQFDAMHAVKRLGSKLWEGVSYNLGEDIAATLPYVFFLRGCRNTIDKIAPGFKIISDHVDNSGGLNVKSDGTIKSEYQAAGMTDLIFRFTGYNVLTQMYRDAYQKIGENITQWKKNDFKITTPEWMKDPSKLPETTANTAKGVGRYMAISTIRSLLQMFAASPFFAIIRSPLSKPSGLIVNPTLGYMQMITDQTKSGEYITTPVRRGGGRPGQPYAAFYEHDATYPEKHALYGKKIQFRWSNDHNYNSWEKNADSPEHIRKNPVGHFQGSRFDPFGSAAEPGRALYYNGFSRLTDTIGGNLEKVADHALWSKSQNWFWKLTGNGHRANLMARESAIAGMPYALYFSAKVFFREKYVNEQMNLAVGRFLDGVLSWNRFEIREGISEIQRTMMQLPFKEPNRQAELIENHRYHPRDKSPIPQNWDAERHKRYLEQHKKHTAPDPVELTAQISQERAMRYAKQAASIREKGLHGGPSGQMLSPMEFKQPAVLLSKKEAGWADQKNTVAEKSANTQLMGV